jgi:hypothetical protein
MDDFFGTATEEATTTTAATMKRLRSRSSAGQPVRVVAHQACYIKQQ